MYHRRLYYTYLFVLASLGGWSSAVAEELLTVATPEQVELFSGEGTLFGQLLWSTGQPAANTRFDLVAYDDEHEHLKIREFKTNAEGHYELGGLLQKGARYRIWQTEDPNQRTFYVFLSRTSPSKEFDHTFQPRIGESAPEFKMSLLDGGEFDLAQTKGKVVVVKFWAVWCGPCHGQMEHLASLLKEHPRWADEVEVVAVNADPDRREVERFIDRKGLEGMTHLFVEGQKWAPIRPDGFRVASLPFTFILDRGGVVRYRNDNDTDLEKVVMALIDESPTKQGE